MKVFIALNGRQSGPYTEHQVREMLHVGSITRANLAWRDGLESWIPLDQVIEIATPTMPPLPEYLPPHLSTKTREPQRGADIQRVIPYTESLSNLHWSGRIQDKFFRITFPAICFVGQKIILKGEGAPGSCGGENGDAIVVIGSPEVNAQDIRDQTPLPPKNRADVIPIVVALVVALLVIGFVAFISVGPLGIPAVTVVAVGGRLFFKWLEKK